jgi:hypothetical protein
MEVIKAVVEDPTLSPQRRKGMQPVRSRPYRLCGLRIGNSEEIPAAFGPGRIHKGQERLSNN